MNPEDNMSTLAFNAVASPFDEIPEANPADLDIRRRAFKKPEQACDLIGKPKRKKVDLNPTERRWLEREGYTFARVETANAWGGMVCDLWGCWDYIAVHPKRTGVLFIQVTTPTNVSARRRKIKNAPETAVLLAAGNRAQIHAWSQADGPGSRWAISIEEIS